MKERSFLKILKPFTPIIFLTVFFTLFGVYSASAQPGPPGSGNDSPVEAPLEGIEWLMLGGLVMGFAAGVLKKNRGAGMQRIKDTRLAPVKIRVVNEVERHEKRYLRVGDHSRSVKK